MSENPIKDKQVVYRQVFKTEPGAEVLADLRNFCFGTKTTVMQDEHNKVDKDALLLHEGRRQVFLQIMNLLEVDFEEYYDYDPEDYLE